MQVLRISRFSGENNDIRYKIPTNHLTANTIPNQTNNKNELADQALRKIINFFHKCLKAGINACASRFYLKLFNLPHKSLSLYKSCFGYISETVITFISRLISHRFVETDLSESFSLILQEGLEWNQLEHRIAPPQHIPNATS